MSTSPDSIGFVYEDTMLRLVDVKRSTWQNWVRAEILEGPDDGRFREAAVVEVFVVASLVVMLRSLRDVKTAWDNQGETILGLLQERASEPIVLLIEPRLLRLRGVAEDRPIIDALRMGEATVAVSLTESIRSLRKDFWRFARRDTQVADGRRRDSRLRRPPNRRQTSR